MSTGSVAVAEVVFGAFAGYQCWLLLALAWRWLRRTLDALLWTVNGGGTWPRGIDHNQQMRDTTEHKM